jgi:hypothetical protein
MLTCVVSLTLVAAAPSSAAAPVALENDAPASGVLTGSGAGAFAYYTIEYPGDESVVTIELRYTPADPVTNAGVGFNVYGPEGYFIGQGMPVQDTGGAGVLTLDYADDNEAPWLVQIYNYIPDHSIAYTVVVTGLPEMEKVAEPVVEVTAKPEAPSTLTTTTPGTLVGNPAGAFALYNIQYPGDDVTMTIELRYVPADPVTTAAVGLNVYRPDGSRIGQGAQCQDTGGDGLLRLSYADSDPATLTVQVYNYLDGGMLYYTLSSALGGE